MTPLYQNEADLDQGGKVSLGGILLKLDVRQNINQSFGISGFINYDYIDYNFKGDEGFAGLDPWDKTHRLGVGVGFNWRFGEDWSFRLGPSVQFSREEGASWSDSDTYGVVLALSKQINEDLTLGIGGGFFTGLEEDRAFPMLMVRWQITENLLLSNPFRPGPTGPAGLELAYSWGQGWNAGIGGAYRSLRFRLNDSGIAPNGIGQNKGTLSWVRLSRQIGRKFSLDAWAGGFLWGEMSLENDRGHELKSDDYDPALLVALTLNTRF
jgi:hypothetical protein